MLSYRPQLDSLRAFAVATVLLCHFWLPETQLAELGVRLFFVLSGFLLTDILLGERHDAARDGIPRRTVLARFYARRILRIWPAYYFALIAAVVFGAEFIWRSFAWYALFASNFLFFLQQSWDPGMTAHLWTLAVEEQFYLVLPLALLFLPKQLLGPVLVGSIAAALVFRAIISLTVSGTLDFDNLIPIASLDALAGGALLALVQREAGPIKWQRLLAWSVPVAVLLELLPLPRSFTFTVGQAILLLPMVAIIAGASSGIGGYVGSVLNNRTLVALGRISYGIYLYHLFVAFALIKLARFVGLGGPRYSPAFFVIASSLTVVVAAASWFIIERPALSLRRYFRRSAAGPLIPAAPRPA